MKFSVGYRLSENKRFPEMILENAKSISEVYFSWGDFPNGRNSTLDNAEYSRWEIQREFEKDLKMLSLGGLKFNLLFNGNCYGKDALSRELMSKIGDTISYISQEYGLCSVTTTSPIIARFIKTNFDDLDVRASVNMGIGTVNGLEYLSEYFDSFYMQREKNRDIKAVKAMKKWCDNKGKRLHMLANSGCLNNCSAHTFHDNLVSHENEIARMDNAFSFRGICHDYISKQENRTSVVRDMSYVRPEDIHLYDEFFASAKLATRVHPNPCLVLSAYLKGKHYGAVTDLLEPSHTGVMYPEIVDNSLFPDSFAETVMNCDKNCDECNYCKEVYCNSLVKLNDNTNIF